MSRLRARWRWIAEAAVLVAALSPAANAGPPVRPATEALAGLTGGERPRGNADAPLTLYLEVDLNRSRLPQLHRFELLDGRLHTDAGTLRALGFRAPDRPWGTAQPIDALPGVEVKYDPSRQRVVIDAPLALLALETTRLDSTGPRTPPPADSSPGVLLNYDLYATGDSHGTAITASSELRVFGIGRGVLGNTAVARRHRGPGTGWQDESVRLDTRWELSFPEHAVTAAFGDAFTGFLDWTRPVRIGGVQIGRNYNLQPYRVTAPMPEFLGEAAVPSDIELYVNGIRQYSGRAPVGPWELTAAPGVVGAGTAHVVVTDAFGQVRSLDFQFYSTERLLARGLSDWSVSLGAVRRDYGIRSFSYHGSPVASGSWRYGVSNRFTAEAHAEGGDGLANAGVGGAWLLGMAGTLHAAIARSVLDGTRDSQAALGYAWNSRRFNVSLDSRRASPGYRDVASLHGRPAPPRSERAMVGVSATRLGNLSLSHTRLDHRDLGSGTPGTSRHAGLFWNRSFSGPWSASLSISRNLDASDDRSLYLSVMVPLGRDHQFSSSWQHNHGIAELVADLSRPASSDSGHGWRLQARSGDRGGGMLAEADWEAEAARFRAGISRWHGTHHSWAQASGSLVYMNGGMFTSQRIHDAFAVVSTAGIAGIPVRHENRLIGETDRRGLLLVPRLNAWQRNKLSIDPLDLPPAVRVVRVDATAVPRGRSGARVQFEISLVRAALVVLHDEDGRPLPLGSRVWIEPANREVVVGYDGEIYVEGLGAVNHATVESDRGACSTRFDYQTESGAVIPRIGPVACTHGPAKARGMDP